MKSSKAFLLFLSLVFLLPTASFAFDGKRQGFLLGLGAGAGSLEYTEVQSEFLASDNRTAKQSTPAFMPKLGYAFGDQLAFLYYRHPFSFSAENAQKESQQMTACVEMLGFNYYFSGGDTSLYIGAGSGRSYFFEGIDNQAPGVLQGTGFSYSIGYEFSKHFSLELTSLSGTLNDQKGEFKGYALLLNVLAY
ncbi:MAG: hypothetical protein RRB13_12780 [bacterium]|nr:hypothetical protein [bacterium]